ncbi:MAG: winged helix-turn-helix domain-containing protein, partial [Rhodothermales bacterium]|nr:winged helix-turn-helix domain-containing protein [Rhodothermales bacterium]
MQEIPIYRFGGFSLDASNRELRDGEHRLDLNTRYFDALVLLVREQGRLVHKERFFEEVWNDVVVSDSALTQCVKEIRRQLGDDVANPRFIETVPRHGYRFIAEVSTAVPATDAERSTRAIPTPDLTPTPPLAGRGDSGLSAALATTLAGTLGGAVAGLLGGFLYGSGLAYSPVDQEIGTASVLLVMISLTAVLGTVG